MCKHILNVQVAIRSPCCKKWFDCAECHAETEDHPLRKTNEMVFACKKCRKVFRKGSFVNGPVLDILMGLDMTEFDESDEYWYRSC